MPNLFDEAIADAKGLKEMAEANARNKIIESISPRIRQLIEQQMMSEQDEEVPAEEGGLPTDMAGTPDDMNSNYSENPDEESNVPEEDVTDSENVLSEGEDLLAELESLGYGE